jgi:AAA-like domain
MSIDDFINLVKTNADLNLTPLQESVLRAAWEGKTYADLATEKNYVKEYIARIAAELWSNLSNFWEKPLNKNNFRQEISAHSFTEKQQQLLNKLPLKLERQDLQFPSQPVLPDDPYYIQRFPIEELACTEITKPGSLLRIKAPWKMGKTSLVLWILHCAEQYEYQTVMLDFQQTETAILRDINQLLRWFSANISLQLQLPIKLNEYWDVDIGCKMSCTVYFQNYLLKSLKNPLVIAINEVDRLFKYPEVAEDFLSLLRSWYEQTKKTQKWQKLRLVLAYSTESHIPLNLNQSPFNVGLPIRLPNFNLEQVQDLAQRHQLLFGTEQIET